MASGDSTATMQLIKEVQNGDENKMEILLTQNEGLIRLVAKRFANRGMDTEDIYQICSIGFIKAVRKFDLSLGLCFSTYAVPTMCGEVKRFLRDDGILKVSRKLQELSMQIYRAEEKWLQDKGDKPTVGELATLLETTEEEIVLALDAARPPDSLYSVINDESSNPIYLIDVVEGQGEREQGEFELILERESVQHAVRALNESERTLIGLRYFKELTQSKTAQVMGISQVQVSRLEKKILEKMRGFLSEELLAK